ASKKKLQVISVWLPPMSPLSSVVLLWLVLPLLHLVAALDPATNADVPACRALAAAAGSQTLPSCHVILAPTLFGYQCNVSVMIEVKTVYGLDESELLEWSGWVLVVWQDLRLAWNDSDGNVPQLKMTRGQIWIPDVGFWNAKEIEFMDLRNAKFSDTTVFTNGTVSLYVHTVIRFPCQIDMYLFPFDTQTCKLEFGGISSDLHFFNFTMESRMSSAKVDSTFYSVGEWHLERLDQTSSKYNAAGQEFGYYSIEFHLRRKPLYYAVLILLPFEM
uniref:Neur_chan_LBD domain-containing protein n=1 Tax=Macrostomum lignano TaxID=282301 RepID=A0A1I8I4U5_9PLAT